MRQDARWPTDCSFTNSVIGSTLSPEGGVMKLRGDRGDRDRVVLVAGIASTLLLALLFEPSARACSAPPSGLYARTVWPGVAESVPTNVRPIVTYWFEASFSFPGPPPGEDLVLLDADGTQIAASI